MAQSLLASEGWPWLKGEIEREIKSQQDQRSYCDRSGDNERSKYIGGIIEGLNIVLQRPDYVANKSIGILERLCILTGR